MSHTPPPMTDAQRAQIITIDLQAPPFFVQVVHDQTELAGLRHLPPGATAFITEPKWSHPELFGRGTVPLPLLNKRGYEIFQLYSVKQDGITRRQPGFRQACDYLCKPLPSSKLEQKLLLNAVNKTVGEFWQLAANIKQCMQFDQAYACLYAERANRFIDGMPNTAIHADGETRVFCALEHRNVLLPDPVRLREKRRTQQIRYVTEAIDAGVPVYQGALGTVTGLFGTDGNAGFVSDHAVYEMPEDTICGRPSLRASFYNTPYRR